MSLYGAAGWDRTIATQIFSLVLYHLSYSGIYVVFRTSADFHASSDYPISNCYTEKLTTNASALCRLSPDTEKHPGGFILLCCSSPQSYLGVQLPMQGLYHIGESCLGRHHYYDFLLVAVVGFEPRLLVMSQVSYHCSTTAIYTGSLPGLCPGPYERKRCHSM